MRRAIEKLFFSLLSLAVASLVTFVMLARLTDALGARPTSLPLLVNTAPRNARDLALAAASAVATDGPGRVAAERELTRLGGAALPHVLPNLDALEPRARGRVALALAPVALRMGVAEPDDLSSPERAIGFFTRFWQDRGADFRHAVVKRKVQRLSERALPLRKKEVTELDTFALPELLEALGRVKNVDDARRVARLSPVLAHVTGVAVLLPTDDRVESAQAVVSAWRSFGRDHGPDFTTLDGPGRLSQTVIQTRYFRWLGSVLAALGPDDPEGTALAKGAVLAALESVPIVLFSLVLAVLVALGAIWVAERGVGSEPFRGALLLGASIPASIAALSLFGAGQALATGAVSLALGAMLAVDLETLPPGQSRPRGLLSRLGGLVPAALGAELALEAALGRGLGGLAKRALGSGDLTTLMWVALPMAILGALGGSLGTLPSPPGSSGPTELEPARRRRLWVSVALVLAAVPVVLTLVGYARAGRPDHFTQSLGAMLVTLGVALGVAAAGGTLLGVLAGGISRTVGSALSRLREVLGAVPQPLVACAALLLGSAGGGLLLGSLRAFEVAAVLSRRVTERRVEEALEAPSGGGAPLAPYLGRLLPHAVRPTAVTVALSVPWLVSLQAAAGALLGSSTAALAPLAAAGWTGGAGAVLLLVALGAACLLLSDQLSPRELSAETPGATVVLALRRRLPSASDRTLPGDH